MKYTLTGKTMKLGGHTLYRIRYSKEFAEAMNIPVLGGWIENESNLSQDDTCRVCDDAKVYGNAKVFGFALVCDDAVVFGNAMVYNDARVFGNARVYVDAKVFGFALVYGNAEVFGFALVCGDADVYGNACIDDGLIPCFKISTTEQARKLASTLAALSEEFNQEA